MPLRVDKIWVECPDQETLSGRHSIESARHSYEILSAKTKSERRKLHTLLRNSHALFHASEMRLSELWESLRSRFKEGVPLDHLFRFLWSSFEADVRFLCDHIMEDEADVRQSLAHAAGSSLIGLRAIIMACVKAEDPPFDIDEMLKFIREAADYRESDDRHVLSPDKAWGDGLSNHG